MPADNDQGDHSLLACLIHMTSMLVTPVSRQPDTTTALFMRTSCAMSVTQRHLSMGPHVATCFVTCSPW